MVKKFGSSPPNSIKADVIVLGCTLPGIVTAHKLKRMFGNTMDIVVLDLSGGKDKQSSKCNVAFHEDEVPSEEANNISRFDYTARELLDNVARFYLIQYAKEFRLPLPDAIINPVKLNNREIKRSSSEIKAPVITEALDPTVTPEIIEPQVTIPLHKLFQYGDGNTVEFQNDFHDFEYLSFLEKFELNQYQAYLDNRMKDLFQTNMANNADERNRLMYYDRTTMEKSICETLLFSTSREIMRITVRLVCGASANTVSLLFYLHQCYRTSSTRNHLGGLNTRFREKLLGQCRKRLSSKLQQSVADITLPAKSIKEIRTYSEQVILETIKGETTYICNLLAMALRPDQLHNIQVEHNLFSEKNADITKSMKPGFAKKFRILYKDNFWCALGYSGDIFSMRGPILWAMEKPRKTNTGSVEKYACLIGFLMVKDEDPTKNFKEAVVEQLINLFGIAAANPVDYRESAIADVYIPRCGDYVALQKMTSEGSPKFLEWGALDIFADGDVAAALEAGHTAYLHLLGCLRPQAQTYDDLIATDWPTLLCENPVRGWLSQINVISSIKVTMYATAAIVGFKLLRSFFSK